MRLRGHQLPRTTSNNQLRSWLELPRRWLALDALLFIRRIIQVCVVSSKLRKKTILSPMNSAICDLLLIARLIRPRVTMTMRLVLFWGPL
ncbi:hypothetical protein JG688_00016759 [Phytophthora aleatoria]|uniref:Uncharacterized protein n=1 Tax=Phytophthora aleatoria TaxID=2496075 RepID=A0A8J5IDL9_9STRA|nr:hypothetical protein JG688_00016759 [Phytophthora aleatoria]